MKNAQIATLLARMADLMEILGQDPFRIGSYRRAAMSIQELTEPIEDYASSGRLEEIPCIGKSMAAKIQQFLDTGKVDAYEELAKEAPIGLIELLRIQGMGPKTVAKLWKEAQITSMEELRAVLRDSPDKLINLRGMGAKKVQQLIASMNFAVDTGGRITLGQANSMAEGLLADIRKTKGVATAVAAGSFRRGRETIGDIDLLVSAKPADAASIIADFTEAPLVQRVLAKGDTKASVVLAQDVQSDLRVVEPASFGAALAYFTGSKAHNVRLRELAVKRGWKLNEYGLFDGDKRIAGDDEGGIYKALGLPYIPPELREDRGEIQAAMEGKLPCLVELGDIRGDFHMHTTNQHGHFGSDGANTIDDMIEACRHKGYKYLCITDHSKSQHQAGGMDEEQLLRNTKSVRSAGKKFPDMLVLAGAEVDILKDGKLDYNDDVLAELDFVLASPHAALGMTGAEATSRILRAIENPHVHCVGHPTGRLIGTRAGMEIDIEAIAKAAAGAGVALEINSHYMRLDLRDIHVRAAVQHGAKICINSDAHNMMELDMVRYGVITARRGWARKEDVLNAMTPTQLKNWLSHRTQPVR